MVIQKVIFMDTAEGVATTLRPYWSGAIRDRAAVVQAQPDMLEIVPPGTSKGSGVKLLLDHLGVTPKEVRTKDQQNYVNMFSVCAIYYFKESYLVTGPDRLFNYGLVI